MRGVWDHDDRERFADRMQAQIEKHAPDFASRIRQRRVLGPRELEQRNGSLIGGAVNGGTSQLHQQLVFRPGAGHGTRPTTGIRGLYLGLVLGPPRRRRARRVRGERRPGRRGGSAGATAASVTG